MSILRFLNSKNTLCRLLRSQKISMILSLRSSTYTVFISRQRPLPCTARRFRVPTRTLRKFTNRKSVIFLHFVRRRMRVNRSTTNVLARNGLPIFVPRFFLHLSNYLSRSRLLRITKEWYSIGVVGRYCLQSFLYRVPFPFLLLLRLIFFFSYEGFHPFVAYGCACFSTVGPWTSVWGGVGAQGGTYGARFRDLAHL